MTPVTRRTALVAVFLAGCLSAGLAAAAPEKLRGNIFAVDWNAMQIAVKLAPSGDLITFRVAPDAEVRFDDGAEFFPGPTLKDLVPPMYIWFWHEERRIVGLIEVHEIPNDLRKPRASESATSAAADVQGQTLKVRILSLNEGRGEFTAKVSGQKKTFHMQTPSDLRHYAVGDTATITVTKVNGEDLVTYIRR